MQDAACYGTLLWQDTQACIAAYIPTQHNPNINIMPLPICVHQDVYDKARIPLIKALKADSITWVSKYARGGSARTQSARKMYIAVDAVSGFLASNG